MEVEDDEEDVEEEEEEEVSRAEPSDRRLPTRRENPIRRVRRRTDGGESTTSGGDSPAASVVAAPNAEISARAESPIEPASASGQPSAWPNPRDPLDDPPVPLRMHFEAQWTRESQANTGIVGMVMEKGPTPMGPRSRFVSFMSSRFEEGLQEQEAEPEKAAEKTLNFERETPEMRALILEARGKEWAKYIKYSAAVPLPPGEGGALIAQGHAVIPSKWVDVDKSYHAQRRDDRIKSRQVSCGNFEVQAGLRTDAPTWDAETHHLIAAFAACHQVECRSADITSAYFQAAALDRVIVMRMWRGGLPDLEDGSPLLIRVPVYGLCDSGRGFWKRLHHEARDCGFSPSRVFQAFYYLNVPVESPERQKKEDQKEGKEEKTHAELKTVAVLTTHVDDLLYAYLPEGKEYMDRLLSRFDVGTQETGSFRYCGKQFNTTPEGITIDVDDNSRKVKPVRIDQGRPNTDLLTPGEISQLRSVVGSLSWIARQGRPDILYLVSKLQSEIKGATVQTARDANKCVEMTLAGLDHVKLRFPYHHMDWNTMGVLSISDASFANEGGMRSQQGRCHFLCPVKQLKETTRTSFDVFPLAFSSTTIKRVCRAGRGIQLAEQYGGR